jgi:S1-C subfamily serine protease
MSGMTPDRGEILSRYQTALVHIEVTGHNAEGRVVPPRLGTGVVVGADGLIITAGHVIGKNEDWAETTPGSGLPNRTIKVTGLNERQISYDLGNASVRFIPSYDLALLRVNARGLQSVLLANQIPPDDSSMVAQLWEPRGVPQAVSAELVTTDWSRNPGLTVLIPVVEGHSGSGLFDSQFRLTGIIVNRIDDRRALAIPVAWIKSDIDSQLPSRAPNHGHDGPNPPTALLKSPSVAAAEIKDLADYIYKYFLIHR